MHPHNCKKCGTRHESDECPHIISFSDIVEYNGKTIRENNLEKQHNIPVGTLVEVKWNEWHGDGACSKIHARLWVVEHNRDCDGTPLYSLSESRPNKIDLREIDRQYNKSYIFARVLYGIENGFAEDQLTPIEVTPELEYGDGALTWDEE